MLQVNPEIVTDGLVYYFDVNNSKCYPWDGSTVLRSLITNTDKLSVAFVEGLVYDVDKRYIQNTVNNIFTGEFSEINLQDFTIQFFLKLNSAVALESIEPYSFYEYAGSFVRTVEHTCESGEITIGVNYDTGAAILNDLPRKLASAVPNQFEIDCNGTIVASTSGWRGGTNYVDNPSFQPLVGGPLGSLIFTKPAGVTTFIVRISGTSALSYNFSTTGSILRTQGLSAATDVEDILFENENIEFEGQPLTITTLPDLSIQENTDTLDILVDIEGRMGFKQANFNPSSYLTSTLKFFTPAEKSWSMFTLTRRFSSFRVYKDLFYEESSFNDTSSYVQPIKINGLTTFLSNFEIQHIRIYNRSLTEEEITKNYKSFYSTYQKQLANLNFKPEKVIMSSL